MKSKTLQKDAKKNGKRDGKNEIPRQNWQAQSVPYLSQLNKQFRVRINDLMRGYEEKRQQLLSSKNDVEAELAKLQELLELNSSDLKAADQEVDRNVSDIEGPREEVPVSRFSRTRLLSIYLYLPILFFLGIAEYLITVPALQFLLGERGPTSALVAICISVASVAYAHVMGASLKERLNRARPQTSSATFLPIIATTFLFSTVIFLSYIRGAYTSQTAGNLSQFSEDSRIWFLTLLYVVIQLTFISLGVYLAFLHHSEIESKKLRSEIIRFIWNIRLKRNLRKIASTKSELNKLEIQINQFQEQGEVILYAQINKLIAIYEEMCALYRSSNIHARKDELDGSHIALQEQKIIFDANLVRNISESCLQEKVSDSERLELLSR